MATAIGVISGLITIFLFTRDELGDADPPNAVVKFKVGLDGAVPPSGGGALEDAGGSKPDIRLWDENGDFLGITTNDNEKCVDGADVCETTVNNVEQQPTYTLLTGNTDAICLSWVAINFPGGQQYGCPLGNWAQECANNHGSEATWYWSNIYLDLEEGGSEPVQCAWLDADSNQPTTGIQLHWPDYSPGTAENAGTDLYCANNFALNFRFDADPSTVVVPVVPARRRSVPRRVSPAAPLLEDNSQYARLRKRFENDSRLVKSSIPEHTASGLCNAATSVGPSFVSYAEKAFCYMPTKTVFPFCDEVDAGACWSDEEDIVTEKGSSSIGISRVSSSDSSGIPIMTFNTTLHWGAN